MSKVVGWAGLEPADPCEVAACIETHALPPPYAATRSDESAALHPEKLFTTKTGIGPDLVLLRLIHTAFRGRPHGVSCFFNFSHAS